MRGMDLERPKTGCAGLGLLLFVVPFYEANGGVTGVTRVTISL